MSMWHETGKGSGLFSSLEAVVSSTLEREGRSTLPESGALPSIQSMESGSYSASSPPMSLSNPTSRANGSQSFGPNRAYNENDSSVSYPASNATGYFKLLKQPNDKQRKAYKNERRYILPNPISIGPKQAIFQQEIKQGYVVVSLVYEGGEEIGSDRGHILEGNKTQALDFKKESHFTLKILDTTDGYKRFQLRFTVSFIKGEEHLEEILYSQPFTVSCKTKKDATVPKVFNFNPPEVLELRPVHGYKYKDTEVWIKGTNLSMRDRLGIKVMFGNKEAKITEIMENLITCVAPALTESEGGGDEDKVVPVAVIAVVSDKMHSSNGQLFGDKTLSFTYESYDEDNEEDARKKRRRL